MQGWERWMNAKYASCTAKSGINMVSVQQLPTKEKDSVLKSIRVAYSEPFFPRNGIILAHQLTYQFKKKN